MKNIPLSSCLFAVILAALALGSSFAQNLNKEQIVAKHQESIGPAEKRESAKNRLALGTSEFESKLPSRNANGKAVIASRDGDLMFLTSFGSQEYPYEKVGYFANRISLPFVTAGTRSPLGAFIADHEKILADGLFTGAISATWALLDSEKSLDRLKSAGTKTINGKKHYVLDYYPKGGGSEFTIKLFFHADTFEHTRTEYKHVIAPKEEKFGVLGQQTGVKISLTEEFSDFKTVDGLKLPHTYRMSYLTDSNQGVYEYFWGVKIQEYRLNQKFDPGFFTFDAKSD